MTSPFVLPEFTRGLRAFGSPAALGDLHLRFFRPLLDARRAAATASRWQARVTAFDAERLEATVRMTLASLASERHAKSAPDRRAMTAQLEDACGDFFDALRVLRPLQQTLLDAGDETAQRGAWAEWVAGLQRMFVAADRGWEHVQPILA